MSYSQDSWIKEYQSSILNFEDFFKSSGARQL